MAKKLTLHEALIASQMRDLLEFIAKGDKLTTLEGRVGHAHQVVGWAKGAADRVLELLGEKP